uniref:Cytochrome c oxidase subunit 3 n=1 Tax=Metschnikowia hamakuensis TaxID=301365 RepID=A0A7D7D4P7_9ASCO|nr:Cox3 [Metschnikowia hamakuensis]YP_009918652.1 Cox3 [Metschnikowia hamakuensis]QMJ95666.1 Cox3 [Metschnikowia hamakuensis]QMJ95667.1 Cox3 [Metschnikowia hamakuensis]
MTNSMRGYMQLHPFHLVNPSPWPLYTSFVLMNLALTIGLTAHNYMSNNYYTLLNIMSMLYVLTLWFKDVVAESTYLGDHTKAVKNGLTQGFYLFVISEILIFASLFWAYLHSSLNPTMEIGMSWPPIGMETMSPSELPLLNTIILLASGVTMTMGHHALINSNRKDTLYGFMFTSLLMMMFVMLQIFEFMFSVFTISDGMYGSTFYALTGLHFFHMNSMAMMLIVCVWRIYNYDFTNNSHVFMEMTVMYLHVLDMLWLFIYMMCYWWGS